MLQKPLGISPLFDTMLALHQPGSSDSLTDNDDAKPGDQINSRVDWTPSKTGDYDVRVTSTQPGQFGPYRLRVQSFRPYPTR